MVDRPQIPDEDNWDDAHIELGLTCRKTNDAGRVIEAKPPLNWMLMKMQDFLKQGKMRVRVALAKGALVRCPFPSHLRISFSTEFGPHAHQEINEWGRAVKSRQVFLVLLIALVVVGLAKARPQPGGWTLTDLL